MLRSRPCNMAFKSCAKKQQPKKRAQITDASGWTHVVNVHQSIVNANKLSSHYQTLPIIDTIPLDQVAKNHTQCLEYWEKSECWKTLAGLLKEIFVSSKHLRLTTCVCLGLGSLSAGRDSSKHELAALISILDLLGNTHTITKVVFQDPAFNDVDKTFLDKLGYSVVSTPLGFESIDQNTFCFAPHLENEIFAVALQNALPALCIGNSDVLGQRPCHSSATNAQDALEILHRFVKATNSNRMPEYNRDSWCHFTSVYWLRDNAR